MNYGLSIVSKTTQEPVTLAQIKSHLHIDADDQDDVLTSFITAARAYAETFLHRTITNTTYTMTLADFYPRDYGMILLPKPPVIGIDGIQYTDMNNTPQTVDSSVYTLDISREAPRVYPAYAQVWPATLPIPSAVQITYEAGYGVLESSGDHDYSLVPPQIIQAIKLTVGHWYEHREESAEKLLSSIPMGAERLLWSVRTF